MATEHWKVEPDAEDDSGAESYPSLWVGVVETAAKFVKALRK